ncbi:hypothetical protein ACGFNU_14675 [Spirillospora sp. NPDC048911]|uniref:hypothetical protein n=1 Tax=Spirillospora sp. NPDC048911 TaxID=3364527 RepID=UPI0037203D31
MLTELDGELVVILVVGDHCAGAQRPAAQPCLTGRVGEPASGLHMHSGGGGDVVQVECETSDERGQPSSESAQFAADVFTELLCEHPVHQVPDLMHLGGQEAGRRCGVVQRA